MTIDEVIGQREVWERLKRMAEEHRIPHAMLFCGPEGCGKLAMALAFASYLLGESDEQTPEAMRTKAMLKKWEHPDLHFTFPTIKSNNMGSDHNPVSDDYIKEWRQLLIKDVYFQTSDWLNAMGDSNKQAIITGEESDALSRKLYVKSSQGGYKISIIWLPERMNLTSANKILKLLEEPPAQTVFILVSEQPEQLLETIRSRTQRISFKKIDNEALAEALIQRRGLEADTARRIARIANGNWNLATEELNAGNEHIQSLDMFVMLMRLAYQRNIHDLKKWSDTVSTFGRERQKRMIDYFQHILRESFMYNFQEQELVYMTQEEEKFTRNFARFINEANIIDTYILFDESKKLIAQNANAKIVFFDMALKIIMLLIRK